MTPLQQTYLGKLKATADTNMAFFEKNMLVLHRLLIRESPNATVDISDQGDLQIKSQNGECKSVTQDMFETEGKLERFRDAYDRPQILAFHKLRAVANNPSYGDMQRYHYSNLDLEYTNRVRRHFVEHFPDNAGLSRYPEFGGNDIPLLIVLGSGLGTHLPRLLLEYKVRHLIIIETDVEAFRLSTFFVDYVMVGRLAMERGTDISFIVQPDLEEVSRYLMHVLRKDNGLPPFFIHGAAVYTAMQDTDTIAAIRTAIVETLWEMFFGLGYFDDELISIKHTFRNLKNGLPIYLKPNMIDEDAVAFIVGSGPSLDGLLPLLRQYKDKAVIFSCGTALSALANAGIKPDIHVEKERPYIIYEVITGTVESNFLKGIHFLGLNVIHQDVFGLFESSGIIMKAGDTMSNLLIQNGLSTQVVLNTQPTVTNTAIDFALSVGFKMVYLFGVDMGYKDKEKHHSEHTAYLKVMPEAGHLRRLLSKKQTSNLVVPGNFDGEVYTNKILYMARQAMGSAVVSHPSAKVYNLNDGASIKGAIPMKPEDCECPGSPEGKRMAIESIKRSTETKRFELEELGDSLLAQLDEFIDSIHSIVLHHRSKRSEVIDTLTSVYRYLITRRDSTMPMGVLLRGALFHLLSLTYNAITIIKDEEEAVAKAEFDFNNIFDFLSQARDEVAKAIEGALA